MIVLFFSWLACLVILVVMVLCAPLIEEDAAEQEQPEDTTKRSEFRARALS